MAAQLKHISVNTPYSEESAKLPVGITFLVIVMICVPLIMWIMKINKEGLATADAQKFEQLVKVVGADLKTVDAMLRNDEEALMAIREAQNNSVVTLIVPEVVIVEERAGKAPVNDLRVNMDGIYWSPSRPLVSINNETYRPGDVIQGYEIVRIDKESVQFRSPDGTIVVKDMYGDLMK